MLHIVNGDSFGSTLKESGIAGEVLVWRESLYEGPLSVTFTDHETREARSNYFDARGVPANVFRSYTDDQESKLRDCFRYKDIVLWFEHDLFDQTMLIYLLQWFHKHEFLLANTDLYLVCIDSFPDVHPFRGLGQLTPQQTRQLDGTWVPVSKEQLELAGRAWNAYASCDPRDLMKLLKEDTSALPFLGSSMKCHLERFPSVFNGLSRVEQSTLEGLSSGLERLPDLFRHISESIPSYGLGDVQYWGYVKGLYLIPEPLIEVIGPPLPGYMSEGPIDFGQWTVRMNPLGEQVMSGQADFVERNEVNRWVGGVHLYGQRGIWRWDSANQQLGKNYF
ncbi:DUF1835 domain-containing protein [Paenibacillus sp. 32352]|uniref:DUF1835 domain-containing protein n=1 Tax=Paenibacillus sp. 32352 TaxID=1969111 RepID=UPI0009AC9B67|nr:DUF1835 domain-containing protein [Paenibacillus sp. 32352]